MPTSNPYENHSVDRLKAIEKELVAITRDPRTPGHKRRLASGDLKTVRETLRKKNR